MKAVIAATAIAIATSVGASTLETEIYRALGMPLPNHFETRASCLDELARAIRQAERTREEVETLTSQISERSGQTGAQEAIASLRDRAVASDAYVSALMTLCQSYS